jgi:hypothetical protein
MWNKEQKQRFQALRSRERQNVLTVQEQAELAQMIQELEEEEAAYLRPATERLELRNLQLAAQNEALNTLLKREERLNRYLLKVLSKVDSERQAIAAELASILERSPVSGTGR